MAQKHAMCVNVPLLTYWGLLYYVPGGPGGPGGPARPCKSAITVQMKHTQKKGKLLLWSYGCYGNTVITLLLEALTVKGGLRHDLSQSWGRGWGRKKCLVASMQVRIWSKIQCWAGWQHIRNREEISPESNGCWGKEQRTQRLEKEGENFQGDERFFQRWSGFGRRTLHSHYLTSSCTVLSWLEMYFHLQAEAQTQSSVMPRSKTPE